MVLDRVVDRAILENRPDVAVFLGFTFVMVGFVSSVFLFNSAISISMVGLSSLLILPYMIKILKPDSPDYTSIFSRRNKYLKFYAFLFLGMSLAYTLLFGTLSPAMLEKSFSNQLEVVGSGVGGMLAFPTLFYIQIVANNLLIVSIAIILSFVYGAGSVFVLNYNASIAGVVYGSAINAFLWGGIPLFSNPIAYLPHTILEILAYLIAALAGTIITKPLTKENGRLIGRDASIMVAAAYILIFVAAWVEVTVPFL